MPEIEWLDERGSPLSDVPPAAEASRTDFPGDGAHARPTAGAGGPAAAGLRSTVAAVLLWAIAAVGSAYASFGTLYRVHLGVNGLPDVFVDGWGRYPRGANAVEGAHGARYGIVLCIVAGVLLVVAILTAAAALSTPTDPTRRPLATRVPATVPRTLGIVAVSLLVGVLAAAALAAQSEIDTIRTELRLERLDTADHAASTSSTTLHYGSLIGYGLVAAVIAIVALLLPFVVAAARRHERRRRVREGVAVPDAPRTHPDDEALTTGD